MLWAGLPTRPRVRPQVSSAGPIDNSDICMSQGDRPTTEGSKPGGRSSGREGEAPAGRAKLLLSRYLGKTRLSRSFALPKQGFEK